MDKSKKKKQKCPDLDHSAQQAEPAQKSAPANAPVEPAPVEQREPPEEALEMRLLRLQADFDNYRKRTLREKAEWELKGNEALLTELLPVLDHFELGLKTAEKHNTAPAVLDGFKMVYEQFLTALRKNRVTPIASEGELFDPNLHEAVTFIPSEEHPAQTIMAETRRGYRLGDRLLRAAQVVVSSGPTVKNQDTGDMAEREENG